MVSELEQLLLTQIEQAGLPTPSREARVNSKRRWRFDFSWPTSGLAVEVEGGQWVQGRHQRGTGFENDCVKYNQAQLDGWRVLRFTGDMVRDGRAIATILEAWEVLHD